VCIVEQFDKITRLILLVFWLGMLILVLVPMGDESAIHHRQCVGVVSHSLLYLRYTLTICRCQMYLYLLMMIQMMIIS
jgi:hypothetical protein